MRIGIYAPNILVGGGLTHLVALVNVLLKQDDSKHTFVIICRKAVAERLPRSARIAIVQRSAYDRGAFAFIAGIGGVMDEVLAKCDVVLNVGPAICFATIPVVSMCRNMLPFEKAELARFKGTRDWWKLQALRVGHSLIFGTSRGNIVLSEYAQSSVSRQLGLPKGRTVVVAHGIDEEQFCAPGYAARTRAFSDEAPCRILYVSTVDVYKHHAEVIRAVGMLRAKRLPVVAKFVGRSSPQGLEVLNAVSREVDPHRQFICYAGGMDRTALAAEYRAADIFVFASTCENLPNILLEAMAVGLPIACSNSPPMPAVLGNAGVYFNAESVDQIANALESIVSNPNTRWELSQRAYARARPYSWKRCLDQTVQFLEKMARPESARVL